MSFFMCIHDLDLRDSSNPRASTGASFYTVCGCLINGSCSLGPSSGLLFHAPTSTHVIPTWDALLWPLNSSSSFSDPRFSAIVLNAPQDPDPRLSYPRWDPTVWLHLRPHGQFQPHKIRLDAEGDDSTQTKREFIAHVMMLARETWAGTQAGPWTEWREWWVPLVFLCGHLCEAGKILRSWSGVCG